VGPAFICLHRKKIAAKHFSQSCMSFVSWSLLGLWPAKKCSYNSEVVHRLFFMFDIHKTDLHRNCSRHLRGRLLLSGRASYFCSKLYLQSLCILLTSYFNQSWWHKHLQLQVTLSELHTRDGMKLSHWENDDETTHSKYHTMANFYFLSELSGASITVNKQRK
jgi:hypothetical protein